MPLTAAPAAIPAIHARPQDGRRRGSGEAGEIQMPLRAVASSLCAVKSRFTRQKWALRSIRGLRACGTLTQFTEPPSYVTVRTLVDARERLRSTGIGGTRMKDTYTAVVKKSDSWWIGWVEEVPGVNCQEGSREELLESLRVTLREALELNRRDAREAAGDGFEEEPIAL